MPVLWSDPTEGQGILPAQAQFYSPAVPSASLVNAIAAQRQAQQQQIANVIPQALAGLQQNMEQRQRDRIANTLLAAQTTGQPVTPEALKTASDVGRFGFGGAPVQNLGGTQAYGAYQQQLALQQKQRSAQLEDLLTGAKAIHYLSGGGADGTPSGKVWSDKLGGWITPYQKFEAEQKMTKAALDPAVEKARKEMETFGFSPEDLVHPAEFHPKDVPGKRKGETEVAYRITLDDGRTALVPEEKVTRWSNLMVAGKFNPQAAATGEAAPPQTQQSPGPPPGTKGTVQGKPAVWAFQNGKWGWWEQ